MDIKLPVYIQKGILSGAKKDSKYIKGKITRIVIADSEYIQVSLFTSKQVFHKNYKDEDVNDIIKELFINNFNNLELYTKDHIYYYRLTAKGRLLTNIKKNTEFISVVPHNNKKNYLIPEGKVVPALIDLGIMMDDGRITKSGFDKYKQINRFIEIIDDCIKNDTYLKIIDFGCGKSYLTFILYYYLVYIKKIDCEIIGLDLKEDVINKCNALAKKYSYSNLNFYVGDIAKYSQTNDVDMIITLHACDTATDYALYHAINMKCRYIFSVPCCQHEINSRLDSKHLHFMNKFGILKERFSSLATDAIRANILQYYGYKTNVMEFVEFENSPKNLLIRAVLTDSKNYKALEDVKLFIEEFGINQTLYELLFKNDLI
ncbi:MAG: class I SAM-dependent methyltransferase [Anaeroplasma sp.]